MQYDLEKVYIKRKVKFAVFCNNAPEKDLKPKL